MNLAEHSSNCMNKYKNKTLYRLSPIKETVLKLSQFGTAERESFESVFSFSLFFIKQYNT